MQYTREEETWGVVVKSDDAEVFEVLEFTSLRISNVTCESANCTVGLTCEINGSVIPLCVVNGGENQSLEFVIPAGYKAIMRITILKGKKNRVVSLSVTGTLQVESVPPAPEALECSDSEEQEGDFLTEESPRRKPIRQDDDSDATVELDTLPRLPSSWGRMSREQKLEAIRRIKDGEKFTRNSDTDSTFDESVEEEEDGEFDEEFEEDGDWMDMIGDDSEDDF